MKLITRSLAVSLLLPCLAVAMGQPPADDAVTKPAATTSTILTVTPYNKLISDELPDSYKGIKAEVLLAKLDKKEKLERADLARLEVMYGIGYVGEEELNPVNQKIYEYSKTVLPENIRKLIEKKMNASNGP